VGSRNASLGAAPISSPAVMNPIDPSNFAINENKESETQTNKISNQELKPNTKANRFKVPNKVSNHDQKVKSPFSNERKTKIK